MANLEFQTIREKTTDFGANNFLEISRTKVISKQGENEFIALKRGYYAFNAEGEPEKRYLKNKNITLPDNEEIKQFILDNLMDI